MIDRLTLSGILIWIWLWRLHWTRWLNEHVVTLNNFEYFNMIVNIFTKFLRFICGPANVWKRQRRRRSFSWQSSNASSSRVASQGRTTNTIVWRLGCGCKMRTSGSSSRRQRRRRQQPSRCYAVSVNGNANALLPLRALAHFRWQWQRCSLSLLLSQTRAETEIERESERIRESALVPDLSVFWFSVRASRAAQSCSSSCAACRVEASWRF